MANKSSDSLLNTLGLYMLHIVSSVVDALASVMWNGQLKRAGIQQYFFRRGSDSNKDAFVDLLSLLEDAIDVKIAVGEMGNRLMENPMILKGLHDAYNNNKANIEIIHGPRVDPKTTTVYKWALAGELSLYCMPVYRPHHFFLITGRDGNTIVVEEGRHLETRWKKVDGEWKESAHSYVRTYFVSDKPNRIRALQNVFRTRKTMSRRSYDHPVMERNKQGELTPRIWRKMLLETWWVVLLKMYYQQKAIIADDCHDIDLHEDWVAQSPLHQLKPIDISTFKPDIPDRARTMYKSRVSPSVLSQIKTSIELTGTETAIGGDDFRHLHMLEYGSDSVGYLDCSTATFLLLITNSIDTNSGLIETLPSLIDQHPSLADELQGVLSRSNRIPLSAINHS